jgi:hypothetical protein
LNRKGNQQVVATPPLPAPTQAMVAPAAGPAPTPPLPPEVREKLQAAIKVVAEAQAEALKSSRWVGKSFAGDARAMHYGDKEPAPIHGQASPKTRALWLKKGLRSCLCWSRSPRPKRLTEPFVRASGCKSDDAPLWPSRVHP